MHWNIKHNFSNHLEINRVKNLKNKAHLAQSLVNGKWEGPMRIWDSRLERPGLCVSRTIGDVFAH